MKKYSRHISKILLTSIILFGVSGLFAPQIANAQTANGVCYFINKGVPSQTRTTQEECGPPRVTTQHQWLSDTQIAAGVKPNIGGDTESFVAAPNQGCTFTDVACKVVAGLASLILRLASLLTGLSAVVLNGVIFHTVVNVSQNYANIESISTTWKVVRDIANMGFIFVLLYAAIMTIIGQGQDNKKLIVNIVVVAILINFSLFFTKIVIDISNVLALTFYDSIAPGALAAGDWGGQKGLSDAFMQHLNLQTLYKAGDNLGFSSIITIGVLGTVMLLIAAFVFFAVALLFIIRYVVLILVLILSPIAFVAYILPKGTGIDKYKDQWVNALTGQAFFAPIYFMLTWVTLSILSGVMNSLEGEGSAAIANSSQGLGGLTSAVVGGTINSGAFVMLINFIIVIVLLIASLLVAKSWADKAGGGMSKLTSMATGFAGGATLGMAGRLGRKTVGSWGNATANDEELKARARAGDMGARLKLATANRMAKSSFDIRGTGIGGTLDAGKAQKGGFIQDQKDKAKAFEKYKPSKDAIDKLKSEETRAQKELDDAAERAIPKTDAHIHAEERLKFLRRTSTTGFSTQEALAHKAKLDSTREEIEQHKEELAEKRKRHIETADELSDARTRRADNKNARQNLEGSMENMAKASERREPMRVGIGKIKFRIPGSGYIAGGKDRAAAIRAAAKGKSRAEKIADLAAEEAKEKKEEEAAAEGTTPPATPTPPPTPPTGGGGTPTP